MTPPLASQLAPQPTEGWHERTASEPAQYRASYVPFVTFIYLSTLLFWSNELAAGKPTKTNATQGTATQPQHNATQVTSRWCGDVVVYCVHELHDRVLSDLLIPPLRRRQSRPRHQGNIVSVELVERKQFSDLHIDWIGFRRRAVGRGIGAEGVRFRTVLNFL